MAFAFKDRVKETTTTSGSGATITLGGAVAGFQAFSAVGNSNTTYYVIEDANGTAWEVGLGTLNSDSTTITRPGTVLANSDGNTSRITLSAGTHTIFCTYPAGKAVYLDNSGSLSHTVDLTSEVTGTLPAGNGGTGLTAITTLLNSNTTASDVGLGSVEDTALSTWAGTTNITTLGTIAAGTWEGTTIAATQGGTGLTSISTLLNSNTTSSDVGLGSVENTALSTWAGTTNITTLGTITSGTWTGAAIGDSYIASASTWDGKQDALTFGIANTNALKVDDASVADNDYAKFTATGIEGQTYAEVKTDLSLGSVENTALSTWAGTTNVNTLGTITSGTWTGTAIDGAYIDIEGTEVKSTGESGGTLFLRENGDGTCSWQAASGGGASDLDDLGDVSFGGTDLTDTLLINAGPGGTPAHGTLGSDCTYNVAIGKEALKSFTDATSNIAIGNKALEDLAAGNHNVAIGYAAYDVVGGNYNVAIGPGAMQGSASTTGQQYNIALGHYAMSDITTGDDNIALGRSAGRFNTEGGGNVALGNHALYGRAEANAHSYNVAIGQSAGYGVTTGDKNIFIGYQTGLTSAFTDDMMLYIGKGLASSDGTLIKGDMANKWLSVGKADAAVDLSTEASTLQVYPALSSETAFYAKMISGQSVDLLRIDDSGGSDLFTVSSTGAVTTGSWTATAIGDSYISSAATWNAKQSAISFGTGVETFLGTPSSANLASAVTDETGTGLLVFATSPSLTTPLLGIPTSGDLANCTFPTLNQDTTGTADKVTVTDSTADTAFPVAFHDESNALLDDTGAFTYNPSSSTVVATTFSGALSGNATTVTNGVYTTDIGSSVQAYNADLSAIAALSSADSNFIVGSAGGWVAESGTTARASLGVDAAGTDNSTDVTLAGTPDYLTISGQEITRGLIVLTTDVSGNLPDGNIASASTWNAKQSALTFGIADTNAVKIDGSGSDAGEYAKFTASGIVGEEVADVKTDLSLNNVENTALSTWAGTTNVTTLGIVTGGTLSTGAIVGGVTMTLGSDDTGDVYYRNASGILTRLEAGDDADVLTLASGLPSWAAPSGGGGSPGGSDTQIQYNNSSSFGGISSFTTDGTHIQLSDSSKLKLGTGADGEIYSASDNLYIKNVTSDKDIIFNVNDGGGAVDLLTLDASVSRVDISGGVSINTTALTHDGDTSYAVVDTDYVLLVDQQDSTMEGAQSTINLPAASVSSGRVLLIKNTSSGSGMGEGVVVDGNSSETIDGSATKTSSSQYDYIKIVCDGSAWHVIGINGFAA